MGWRGGGFSGRVGLILASPMVVSKISAVKAHVILANFSASAAVGITLVDAGFRENFARFHGNGLGFFQVAFEEVGIHSETGRRNVISGM